MNDKIKEQLMQGAVDNGICDQGRARIMQSTLDDVVDYYIEVPNWGMEREFPSIEMLRKYFGDISDKGVYVDCKFNSEAIPTRQAIILHHCSGTVDVRMDKINRVIPVIYIGNNCDVTLRCSQRNFPKIRIPVYIFGDNKVAIEDNGGADFLIKHKEMLYG